MRYTILLTHSLSPPSPSYRRLHHPSGCPACIRRMNVICERMINGCQLGNWVNYWMLFFGLSRWIDYVDKRLQKRGNWFSGCAREVSSEPLCVKWTSYTIWGVWGGRDERLWVIYTYVIQVNMYVCIYHSRIYTPGLIVGNESIDRNKRILSYECQQTCTDRTCTLVSMQSGMNGRMHRGNYRRSDASLQDCAVSRFRAVTTDRTFPYRNWSITNGPGTTPR